MKTNARLLLALLVGAATPAGLRAADTLTALGRVVPRSGVVDVSGPAGDTVEQILVREGDWVEAGQPLAKLSSAAAAARRVADAEAEVAATRTAHARDLELARARLALAETEAKLAAERFNRLAAARTSDFISPDQIETRQLEQRQAEVKRDQAKLDLERTDRAGLKGLRAAEGELAAARAALAAAEVRAPLKARVLKVRGRPGATVGRTELVKLGDTSAMLVVTEVYEADVLKVKPGQKAVVTSSALPKKLAGTVESVSRIVFRNALESIDPNDNAQARVVEVTLRMDDTEPLDRLVLLQVDVVISL